MFISTFPLADVIIPAFENDSVTLHTKSLFAAISLNEAFSKFADIMLISPFSEISFPEFVKSPVVSISTPSAVILPEFVKLPAEVTVNPASNVFSEFYPKTIPASVLSNSPLLAFISPEVVIDFAVIFSNPVDESIFPEFVKSPVAPISTS